MAGTYTAASVALSVVPDLSGTFAEIDRKFGTYSPKPITPQVKPEVDDKAADEIGPKGRFGAKALVAGAAVGAAIGSVVSSALSGALDVAAAQGKLQAQLGGNNPQWAREMGAIAGKLYSTGYGENLESVNDALRSVIQSGAVMEDASNEQISSVTSGVLNLAKAFGVDTAEAARAVGTVMRNGLAPDAETALDVVTRGFQQGVDIGGDFLDTLNEYSGQFAKFGIDAQTATGLLSQGLQAGARDSDFVADALKEFSIRAVDGSKTTAQGFQALGLSADDMARRFGAGGQEAAGALDLTLDKLREMPDPVQRSQAAVALFGTKAEDLGAALFALDPSTAAQGLGEVGGAAEGMGEALMTPADRIEGLKRSFQMGLVDLIGGRLLPLFDQVMGWGSKLFGSAWEPVKSFLGFLAGTGGVIVGILGAIAAGFWLWSAASAALSASLLANPITWVIAGIVALVAVVIYAWNNFDWFRNAVMAVWDFLKGAASWIAGVFVAVWNGLVTAVQWVGNAFTWLWQNVLSPVFSFLADAAKVVAAVVLTVLITPLMLAWQALSAAFQWWWQNVTWPVFQAVGAVATWLWANVLQPVFGWIAAGWALLMQGIQWVWQNVLKPAWDAIAAAANWLWINVLQPVFGWIAAGWQLLLAGIQFYWQNVLKPVWDAVSAAANWLWNNVLSPVFGWIAAGWRALLDGIDWVWQNVLKPALDAVGRGFDGVWQVVQNVVKWIGDRWADLQELARKPVAFIVDTVYNHGIRPVWNGVAKTFGLGELDEVHMAEGGVLPGYTPGRDVHTFWSPTAGVLGLSGGEGILVPEAVRALGPGFVGWANRIFSGGRSSGGRGTGYADGGIWGSIGNAILGAAKAIPGVGQVLQGLDLVGVGARVTGGDDLRKILQPAIDGLLGNVGAGGWADALKGMVDSIVDAMVGATDKAAEEMQARAVATAGGSAQVAAWIQQAMGIAGVPPNWAGPLMTLIMRESGGNPNAINLWDSNAKAGHPSQGLMQTIPSTFAAYRNKSLPNNILDPIANIVAGINYIKARYGSVFNVQQAVGATPKGYDSGGWLPPGYTAAFNGTGKPEAILTHDQWQLVSTAVRGGDQGAQITLQAREPMSTSEITRLAHEIDRVQAWKARRR